MINPVSNPQCYNAFNCNNKQRHKPRHRRGEAPPSVKLASALGAGVGALGVACLIAKKQSVGLEKAKNLFNIKYSEPELISVALASVAGGLAAGGLVDKSKHFPMKIKEATHQAIANIFAPLLLISGLNKIYDKIQPKSMPQFKSETKMAKFANETIKMLPRLTLAVVGLTAGIHLGTAISNKINGIDDTRKERKVKPVDFAYHPDDIAAAFAIADKNGALQKFVSKIIPPIFMFHGYDTGTRR